MTRHVVFGAGQVGTTLAERLAAGGHTVRLVSRSSHPAPNGVEMLRADVTDRSACLDAARDAAVLYHCMNPDYSVAVWNKTLPVWQDNLLAAAKHTGARLVVLENIYAFGDLGGLALTESTPRRPRSRKGEIRARLAEGWYGAHVRGDARVVLGHGSDFFGPRGTQTFFEERFWTRVLAGKSAQVLVPPDQPHTYHYIPDVAAGLATLGTAPDDAYGIGWMLPCAPAVTTRELIALMGKHLGREVKVDVLPTIVRQGLKLFIPLLREFEEMRYQWDAPFVVDDSRFRARFDSAPTPLDRAAAETVNWARTYYSKP
jgi:nucleoside-diphosphate-sugar epimerase